MTNRVGEWQSNYCLLLIMTGIGVHKPRLLVISKVLPFLRSSGQQQRVYYKLKAFQEHFHITFLTAVPDSQVPIVKENLRELCDEAIVLSSRYSQNSITRAFHRLSGQVFSLRSGLKLSNYVIGKVEFSPARLREVVKDQKWDGVLYEYWHAVDSVDVFRQQGIPCVLDMHNVLWQSLARQYEAWKTVPIWWKESAVRKYRVREENSWNRFDALIAINAGEYQYAQSRVDSGIQLFYSPMGTDLTLWPYSWQPVTPSRVAYYGGLGSSHNRQDAFDCYDKIMPTIWRSFPGAQLWLVGSDPSDFLKALHEQDSRVIITGFVDRVQDVLKTVSVLLCPWSGTYGFRSRLIEAMALGIPVIASPDAVYGMGMKDGQGILLEADYSQMAQRAINLLRNEAQLRQQSKLARQQIEERFSYKATYGRLAEELLAFLYAKGQVQ